MGFTADPSTIRKAGASATSAGEQAAGVRLGETVGEIAAALPGGKSEGAAKALQGDWAKEIKDWSASATRHGQSLAHSAREYEAGDQSGADTIRMAPAVN